MRGASQPPAPLWQRLLWLVGLWLAGVATLAAVTFALRAVLFP